MTYLRRLRLAVDRHCCTAPVRRLFARLATRDTPRRVESGGQTLSTNRFDQVVREVEQCQIIFSKCYKVASDFRDDVGVSVQCIEGGELAELGAKCGNAVRGDLREDDTFSVTKKF